MRKENGGSEKTRENGKKSEPELTRLGNASKLGLHLLAFYDFKMH